MRLKFVILLIFIVFVYGCSFKNSLEQKTYSEVQPLSQVTMTGGRIGEVPPDFIVVTTEGKAVRLSDFAEQKKPVIVYFMATWCPYCAQDYKALSKVYPKYENDVSFISISLDLSEDLIKLIEYKKKYPELKNTMFAPGQYSILVDYSATKTTKKFAIGSDGTIKYIALGAFDEEQWDRLLSEMSKQK
ncbi:redoxin domain-containing protein [Candidatus Woesearchaeota archaeon]|nr:redoxin domain-containing protein [Candidatus Woesearchaeota archaeon]